MDKNNFFSCNLSIDKHGNKKIISTNKKYFCGVKNII